MTASRQNKRRPDAGRVEAEQIDGHDLAEAAARELAAIVENSENAIIGLTLDGIVVSWNRSAERIYGYAAGEIMGRSIFITVPPDEHRTVQGNLEKLGRGERVAAFEGVRLKKGGEPVCVAITVSPIRDAKRRPTGASLIVQDITSRRQSEEQIERLLSQNTLLLESMGEGVFGVDRHGNISFVNPAAARMLGYRAEELVGRCSHHVFHHTKPDGTHYPNEECPIYASFRDGAVHRVETEVFWRQDHTSFPVEYHSTPIRDKKGALIGAVATFRDVTDKKMLEARFLRAQRMESIGTLAGGIAHDLNNVLAPIMMALQLLKQKLPDQGSQQLLTTLATSAQRGADIVKQVLSFARGIEGKRVELQLRHLLIETEKILSQTFPKSIQISRNVPNDLWLVTADVTQIHQVLMNLCVNARDAMPAGGRLTLSAENVSLNEERARACPDAHAGDYVMISVQDTGTGISPDVIEKIFDPFFTTKEIGKGTGLGLSTVVGILKSHGGFVNVYSEIGRGANFKVYLPRTGSPQAKTERAEKFDLPHGQGEWILLADDEASIREIARGTLESYGYRVVTANDGIEAIALYAQNRHHLRAVIVDMMMPLLDGPQTIRTLRKLNPNIPIIASSGLLEYAHATASQGVDGIEAQAFLQKPYSAEKLLKTLRHVLHPQ